MRAVEQRMLSHDPIKRVTYRYQYWLAAWRLFGGNSDNETARYMRQKCREVRFFAKQNLR